MEELFTGLANFTFPIVMAVYLLVRVEKKIENLTIEITKLTTQISVLSEKIERLEK